MAQKYKNDFYEKKTETEWTKQRKQAEQVQQEKQRERTEQMRCARSRKKQARFFGVRQTAAMCLGAAVLGGAIVGVCQKNGILNWNTVYTAEQETVSFITEMKAEMKSEIKWDGLEASDMTGQRNGDNAGSSGSTSTVLQMNTQNTDAAVSGAAGSDGSQNGSASGSSRVIGGMDVSDIAASALPSVVSITTISVQEVQQFYNRFGRNGQGPSTLQQVSSCGSGVIITKTDNALYMVTNYHVIEGANTISVSFADGTVCKAELCGTDSGLDLAVVKVSLDALSADTLSQISVVSAGDSDALRVGEQVVAIGNALGYGQSVTTGIVSALNRAIITGTDSSGNTLSSTYIQTDAAINPGNSGGALLNMSGELIGINTAKASSTEIEGMGYAIPISKVWAAIQELMVQTPGNINAVVQQNVYGMPEQNWQRR